jgi:hypothetical protein
MGSSKATSNKYGITTVGILDANVTPKTKLLNIFE